MHIPIVCEAHLQAKHAKTRGLRACPRKFRKFGPSKVEFQGIFALTKPNTDDDET